MKNANVYRGIGNFRTGTRTHSEQGWRDYLAGMPFPLSYDIWKDHEQRNYEHGRMRAAAAKYYYTRVPREQTTAVVKRVNIFADGYAPPRN
jgi:hypothetical protein